MTDNITIKLFEVFQDGYLNHFIESIARGPHHRAESYFVRNGKKIHPKSDDTDDYRIDYITQRQVDFIFEIDETTFILRGPSMAIKFGRTIRWIGITPTEDQLVLMKLALL